MKNKKKFKKSHKFINIFYILLMNMFGLKHQIDNRKYRKAIYHFLRFNDAEYQCLYITNIKVFKHKRKIIVEIETHRPGILIGKAGHFIDSLKEYIENETKQKIDMKIRECRLWMNLYS